MKRRRSAQAAGFIAVLALGAADGTADPVAAIVVTPHRQYVKVMYTEIFRAQALDASGNPLTGFTDFSWSGAGGALEPTQGQPQQAYYTPLAPGTGWIECAAPGTGVRGKVTFRIVPFEQTLASVSVNPVVAVIKEGGAQQFSPKAWDTQGLPFLPPPVFDWTATGGAVTSGGVYTGTTPGVHHVTATARGTEFRGSAQVEVAGPVAAVVVSPGDAFALQGQHQQFAATAYDAAGTPVPPPTATTWTAGGGTIDATGRFMAETAGSYAITGAVDGVTGFASVQVVSGGPGPISSIVVQPDASIGVVGDRHRIHAQCFGSEGQPIDWPVSPMWSASQGEITQGGLFTATAPGVAVVHVRSDAAPVVGIARVYTYQANPFHAKARIDRQKISWPTSVGYTYTLQRSSSPAGGSWSTHPEVDSVPGTGGLMSPPLPTNAAMQNYYKVQITPPE